MSLESSHEHTEQKQRRLAIAAETDHSSVAQEDSELSRNVTFASVLPDPDELTVSLQSWICIPDWPTSQTYLQTHPELLTEVAVKVLATLTQHQPDQHVHEFLKLHQQLLQVACQQGVEAAYQTLLHQGDENSSAITETEQEELQVQVIAWLQKSDWETSQAYLHTHPRLLTDAVEQMLEGLKHMQKEEQAQALINLHQVLLQQARVEGIEAAYEHFLAPEPEALLSDQGVANYQDFEDPTTWNDAGMATLRQYWVSGQVADLNRAVECWHEALKLTSPNSPNWSNIQNNLGFLLHERYTRTRDLADLEAAITAFQQAVQAISPNAPEGSTWQSNLGNGLYDRYARTGNLADLEAAITAYQQAVQATPPDAPDWPSKQNNLGIGLRARYTRTKDLADLEVAITAFQQAVQATSPNAPEGSTWQNNLGNGLHDHYAHTGNLADLEAAITAYQQAVQSTPPNAPNRAYWQSNLGNGLHDRYARTGNLADLEAAITAYQQAVQATPPDAPDWSAWQSSLGNWLHDHYAHTKDLSDLEAAIIAIQQAIQSIAPGAPDWSAWQSNLGVLLHERCECTGNLADLEAAITAFQQLLQATSPDAPDWSAWQSNLGAELGTRYERIGDLADLEAAITAYQQAVQSTPSDSPDWPARWNNLGTRLRARYRRSEDLTDLEAAITAFQQAVQATPSDSPDQSGRQSNLGVLLQDRYERTKDLTDLEAAITAYQQAVQATPSDSPDWPHLQNNLGNGLYDRYTRTGDLTDLEAAITTYQQAVQATPPNALDWPARWNNLGVVLRARYRRSGNPTDLEVAITAFQQVLQATPSDSPDWPRLQNNLGLGLLDRYASTGELTDLEAAITAWEKRWFVRSLQFTALPVVYKLGQQRQESGISRALITAYLEHATKCRPSAHADLRSALVVAEGTKSRLLTQLTGRGSLPLPTGLSPQIAEREQQLLADLTTLDTQELATYGHSATAQEETSRLNRLQRRQADLSELVDLWTSIGRLGSEGMEYVALRRGEAQNWQSLTQLAKKVGSNTALLSFFTTSDSVLLFLLRAGWRMPRVVEAPLNQTSWTDLLERFFREVHRYSHGQLRGETWDQALRPLLTQVQRHLTGIERLILAPAGNGHLLPWSVVMERMGWHTPANQSLPLVILPSLGVLSHLRRRPQTHIGSTLVVGNPISDLPYAEDEAREVAQRFGTDPLLGSAATKEAVLSRLEEASLIHLATHAFFDSYSPLESGIILADGVLTAREVLQHRLHADLLVLSACESGQVGSLGGEELAGLSQAFLQAGVRSLIVSLWRVNDPATAALMRAFYTIRQTGADKALALRQAMTQIQQDPRWTHPYYWGAFVLMGDWE